MVFLAWLLAHLHGALALHEDLVANAEACGTKPGRSLLQVSHIFQQSGKKFVQEKFESKGSLKTRLFSIATKTVKKKKKKKERAVTRSEERSFAGCPLAFSSSVRNKIKATPLDASGFDSIKALCCPIYMKEFIRRVIKDHWSEDVCLEGGLSGMTLWFQCNDAKGTGNDWPQLLSATAPGSDARNGNCPFIGIPPNCPPLVYCESFPQVTMPPCQHTTTTTNGLGLQCASFNSSDCINEHSNAVANGNLAAFCNRCLTETGANPLRNRCKLCCDACGGGGGAAPTTTTTTITMAATCAGYTCPAGYKSMPNPSTIPCSGVTSSCTMIECCEVDPSQCGGTPQVSCATPTTHFWDIDKAHVVFLTANVDCCSARGSCVGFSCLPGFEVRATTYCPGPISDCTHDVCCQILPGVTTTTTTTTTVTKLATTTLTTTCWAGVVGSVTHSKIDGACGVSLTYRADFVLVIGQLSKTAALVDVSIKSTPTVRSLYDFSGDPDCAVVCDGNFAYTLEEISGNTVQLVILDMSSPLELLFVASLKLAGYGTVAAKYGNYLFISHNNYHTTTDNRDVSVVDVSDHLAPVVVGYHQSAIYGAYGGYIYGDYLYLAVRFNPGLAVVNVSNKVSPTLLSMYYDSGLKGAMWLTVRGNIAYISGDYCQCIRAFDITDAAHPKFLGSAVDPNSVGGIVAEGDYIIEHGHNLLVWDVSAAKPKKSLDFFDKTYMGHGGSSGVAVQNNHVFWVSWNAGMQVIDVSCLPGFSSLI